MDLPVARVEGSNRIMTYEKPRPAIIEQGVERGTVLFEVILKGEGKSANKEFTGINSVIVLLAIILFRWDFYCLSW